MGFFDRLFGGNVSLTDTHLIESAVEQGVRNAQKPSPGPTSEEQQFTTDKNRVRYELNKRHGWPKTDVYDYPNTLSAEQFEESLALISSLSAQGEINPRNAKIMLNQYKWARRFGQKTR